jgi:hypothetical protein
MNKPLHEQEREEWKKFTSEIKPEMREIAEKAKSLKMARNLARGQQLVNHFNVIRINILD